jgi:hypothetical protein
MTWSCPKATKNPRAVVNTTGNFRLTAAKAGCESVNDDSQFSKCVGIREFLKTPGNSKASAGNPPISDRRSMEIGK